LDSHSYFGQQYFRQQTEFIYFGQQYSFGILLTYLILCIYVHIYLVFGSHECVLKYSMRADWDKCYVDVLMILIHFFMEEQELLGVPTY
jgi:hypothetical protein